jgi:predicted O-methyltransferase YrrM
MPGMGKSTSLCDSWDESLLRAKIKQLSEVKSIELSATRCGGAKKSLQIRKYPASAARLMRFLNDLFDARQSATGVDHMQNLRKSFRALKGIADYKLRDHRKFYPWGFAMNGQTSRLEAVRQIIYAAEIARIIETGTFRGTTAEWFAQFGLPVETVEADERFFAFSKARLSKFGNVGIHLDSSTSFLAGRLAHANRNERVLFYLDAHWENSLPLRDELQIIFAHHPNSVIVIDDFNVRDDDGYHYDNYGPDRALTLEYIENSNLPAYHAFYPATPSKQETGMRSGWIVLTPDPGIAQRLRTIALLRDV